MTKLKPLLPTLKEKKRYLVFEIISQKPLVRDISKELVTKVQRILGVFDAAKAGLMSIRYNVNTQRGVMKVSNKYVEKLKVSLMLTNMLENQDVLVQSLGVSGVLKKTEKFLKIPNKLAG